MHQSNQTTIHGVNVSYPLIFTGNQCKRAYSRANSLLDHINIYDQQLPEIDYLFFSELRGSIRKIADQMERKAFGLTDGSESNIQKKYTFSESKELLSIAEIKGDLSKEIALLDSLKKRSAVVKTEKSGSEIIRIHTIYFTNTMDFERFEDHQPSTGESIRTVNSNPRNEKYVFNNGKVQQKIQFINNAKEQSKMVYDFLGDSNIERVTARSQKDQTVLLYQTLYSYNQDRNINSIIFESLQDRDNPTRSEFSFGYNEEGNLIETNRQYIFYDEMGNIVRIEDKPSRSNLRFERVNSYEYDHVGNWTRKESELIRFNKGQKELVESSITTRTIEYF